MNEPLGGSEQTSTSDDSKGVEILRLAGCLDDIDNDVAEAVLRILPEDGKKVSAAYLMQEVQKIKDSLSQSLSSFENGKRGCVNEIGDNTCSDVRPKPSISATSLSQPSEIRRNYYVLLDWALSKPREKAEHAFTEGDLRQVAYLIEEYDKKSKEAEGAQDVKHTARKGTEVYRMNEEDNKESGSELDEQTFLCINKEQFEWYKQMQSEGRTVTLIGTSFSVFPEKEIRVSLSQLSDQKVVDLCSFPADGVEPTSGESPLLLSQPDTARKGEWSVLGGYVEPKEEAEK